MKKCYTCNTEKPKVEFYPYNNRKCKACIREYSRVYLKTNPNYIRKWKGQNREQTLEHRRRVYWKNRDYYVQWDEERRRVRSLWFLEYKQCHPCEECGVTDHRCLEFHHINGRGKEDIPVSQLSHRNQKRVLKEIQKCQILCANCHRIKHYKEIT